MSRYAEMLRLVGTVQEFIDTNPNEVKSLADSALLIEALDRDLNGKDTADASRSQPLHKWLRIYELIFRQPPRSAPSLPRLQ